MSTAVVNWLGEEGFGSHEVDWTTRTFNRVSRSAQNLVLPGFVDLHIHGAFGIDFMGASRADMEHLATKLRNLGYEAFLPTTVAATVDAVKAAVENLPDDALTPGFHLEGPFLSPKFPGAQPPERIVEPSPVSSEWDEVLDHPKLRMITLAPELPHTLELITRLMKRGVRVSMGHSNATFEEARRGFEFGAAGVTHMFNAMRPLHHREVGLAGYALSNDQLATELIYDRLHVSREAASLLFRVKGPAKVVAVSDSVMATGLPAGMAVEMWGLSAQKGRGDVRLADGTLAGSAITLLDAFRNLYEDFGPEIAVRACCLNPRRELGMTTAPTVLVELDKNLEIVEIHDSRGL